MDQKKNILILEANKDFALHLARALKALGPARVSISPAVREAALQLVQRPQDLAFIPVTADDHVMRSLRAIQPDLRLILLIPTPDTTVPEFYSGQIQAVLIKSLVDVDLASVMKQADDQPFLSAGEKKQGTDTAVPDTAVLIAALQQAQLGQLLQTVIFAQAAQVLAHWGNLNDTEVANVALHTGREWLADQYKTRVQFLHLPPRAGEWLLYTTCLEEAYLLTLVAAPEMPMPEIRRQAAQLAGHLQDVMGDPSHRAASGPDRLWWRVSCAARGKFPLPEEFPPGPAAADPQRRQGPRFHTGPPRSCGCGGTVRRTPPTPTARG